MRRRILAGYLSLVAAVLILLEVPLGLSYAHRERTNVSASVQRDAAALASLADDGLERPGTVDLATVASRYRSRTGGNVSIVDATGHAVVSLHPQDTEVTEADLRPLVRTALQGRSASRTIRFMDEGSLTIAAVVAVGSPGKRVGAVVMTTPASTAERRIHRNWLELGALGLGVLAVATAVGLSLARSVTRPLRHLEQAAGILGAGDLSVRADVDRGPPEVRALAEEFNQMAERLGDLVDAQRVFVADASHQLRTPLTALRLRLENLEASVSTPARADVTAAAGEVRRLSRIVDGLLALARAEGSQPQRNRVDVAGVIDERRSAWEPLADERQVRLAVEPDMHGPVRAWMVPGHLEQILDNLLANALEATPAGGTVSMRVVRHDGTVRVHVMDEGKGLTPDERTHAFDRFWQGRRASGSSGLGLAIVRQLARASGADVELEAAPSGGLDATVMMQGC